MEIKEVEESYGKMVRYNGDNESYKLCGMYSNAPSETLCWLYDDEIEMRFLVNRTNIELV